MSVPIARYAWTAGCAPYGACHIWLDDVPNGAVWERIANDGRHMPAQYDMIVFPPVAGNPWGHVASVDHVANGQIYVMDDNYVASNTKAATPHTVAWAAYGWYHLRKLGASGGSAACGTSGLYCGGDSVVGDRNTLYACNNHALTVDMHCARGCRVEPAGVNDRCN